MSYYKLEFSRQSRRRLDVMEWVMLPDLPEGRRTATEAALDEITQAATQESGVQVFWMWRGSDVALFLSAQLGLNDQVIDAIHKAYEKMQLTEWTTPTKKS